MRPGRRAAATLTCFLLFWGLLYSLAGPIKPAGDRRPASPTATTAWLARRTARSRDLRGLVGPSDARASDASSRSSEPRRRLRPTAQLRRRTRAGPKPHVAGLGETLYTDHLVTVELAGALLFVALVGALAIADPQAADPPRRRDPAQIAAVGTSRPDQLTRRDETSFAMTPTDIFTFDILRNYLLVGAALMVLGMLGFLPGGT